MTIWGTSYFRSFADAVAYYKRIGYSPADITKKVEAGEIHIGKPDLNPGEKLVLIRDEGRYAIEESKL